MRRILSEKECRILVAAQLKARAGITALETETGYPAHVIRHTIKRFLDSGILVPYTLINIAPLGFDKVAVFFSLRTNDPDTRRRAIDYLLGLRCVVSVSELVGDYEYFMSLACRGTADLAAILGQISETIGCFHQHAMSSRVDLVLYQRRYLAELNTPREFVAYHMGGERIDIGPEYLALLAAIDECGTPTPAELARRTSQPLSTVTYRVARLEQERIIVGYLYGIQVANLGFSMHDILLSTRSSGAQIRKLMHDFCLSEPHIIGLTHCLGSWQFELRVEVGDSGKLMAICNRIKAALGDQLLQLTTHTMVRELKYMKFPLDLSLAHGQRRKVA